MSIAAVAGGTGQLGRTIVDAVIADGTYHVVILSRTANAQIEKETGSRIIVVDYNDIDAVAGVLEENKVHTVISTISPLHGSEPEIGLIRASERSPVTKRYINSFWATDYPAEFAESFFISRFKYEALRVLEKTSLEYTAFRNGYFLDYFVAPHVKSHMGPQGLFVDAAHNIAAIPGSGDEPIVFTYSFDVARFVAASLHLPKWDRESYIIGDKVTWNQFVKLIEAAKGVKFDVAYDSIEALEAGQITELPSHASMYEVVPKEQIKAVLSAYGLIMAKGGFDLNPQHTLNDAFPEIKTKTVAELVHQAWGQH